jgi:hypothetical protein
MNRRGGSVASASWRAAGVRPVAGISWTSAGLVGERDNAGEGAGKNTNPACLAASVFRVLPYAINGVYECRSGNQGIRKYRAGVAADRV